MSEYLPIDHPRFKKVQRSIFVSKLAPDCMSHQCRLRKENDTLKLEACCQYGADVDIAERDAILSHADQIKSILDDEVAELPWFTDTETEDVDFPSGKFVRTRTHEGGCLFLKQDKRGCSIHRASLEGGWDFDGIKPNICRLFPMSYESDAIVMSDDYADYSCAFEAGAPSVYQVGRPDLLAIFGSELVAALDLVEKSILEGEPKSLGVIA